MFLWTVHPVAVLESLRKCGRLRVDPLKVNPAGWVHPQYAWLADQMRRLIGGSGGLPWFAYSERPDLRSVRHTRPKGSREVLIEFEADACLAFPCWAWHRAFTSQYLALSSGENRDWEAALKRAGVREDDYPLPKPLQRQLEASWLRLFDPTLPPRRWGRDGFGARREAVVEELEWARVCSVKEFTGTFSPPRIPSG